jgi:mRNA deadenylase 3'-5' endonuclease subunit Ccr4
MKSKNSNLVPEKGDLVKVMHWNILSDYRAKKFFAEIVSDKIRDWSYRSFLIQEHIKKIDPDVFGLCDLDSGTKQKFLSKSIKEMGYQEFHTENCQIGISIFYKE